MLESETSVPWPRVRKFVGQLNHDLRNHLNAIELQAAFVSEIAEGEETKSEMKRLRAMVSEMGAELQRLSAKLAKIDPQTMPYRASELVEDLRAKVEADFPDASGNVQWDHSLGAEMLEVDPHLVLEALAELFANAFRHARGEGALRFSSHLDQDRVAFTLTEPKSGPVETSAPWGSEPLTNFRHGHYSLGLFRARAIFAAHGGSLQAQFDPASSALVVTVMLPLATS